MFTWLKTTSLDWQETFVQAQCVQILTCLSVLVCPLVSTHTMKGDLCFSPLFHILCIIADTNRKVKQGRPANQDLLVSNTHLQHQGCIKLGGSMRPRQHLKDRVRSNIAVSYVGLHIQTPLYFLLRIQKCTNVNSHHIERQRDGSLYCNLSNTDRHL